MDYRTPFELRKQFLEEARAAQVASPSKKGRGRTTAGDSPAAAPPTAITAVGQTKPRAQFTSSLPDDPTTLVCEIPEAENLRALSEALEHEEAVQRYLENENLTLEESVRYIMANGSTGQKLSFFSHVQDSLMDLSQKQLSRVLALLLDSMWTQDPELQCRVPDDLLGILGALQPTTAGELLDVTRTMLTVRMAVVRQAWGRLLLGLVGCLSLQQLETEMVPLALRKTEHAEPQDQRELSCDLLGTMCDFIPREKVEELVLPRALALCQDTNVGVRQHMCQQLVVIARSLGVETARARVAPDLFELLNDEERSVSRSAFTCLLDLVEFFGPEYRKERLYPIIKSFISNPPSEVVNLLVVEFGRFLHKIKGDITSSEDVAMFASFYQNASQKSDEEARRHCAFHFPAVAASLPLSVFPTHLSPCLNRLASDSSTGVRRCIAAGLHELVSVLGEQAAQFLEKPFLTLLRDQEPQVRVVLFQHVNKLVECFATQLKPTPRRAFFDAVAELVLKSVPAKTIASVNWHTIKQLVQIVEPNLRFFDESRLTDCFVPVLLAYMKQGAVVVKDDCARLVVRCLLQMNNVNAKVQVLSRITNDFARSSSCYQRQSYFRFVREIERYFSRRFVRERLLEYCLELQRDSVSFVRLSLARSLPCLSKGLRADGRGALEEEFANMVQRIIHDDDAEVRAAARESVQLIQTREAARRRDAKGATAEDQEDQWRERQEHAVLELAKECDKAERRAKLRDLLKTEREKELAEGQVVGGAAKRAAPSGNSAAGPGVRRGLQKASSGPPLISRSGTAVGALPRIPNSKSHVTAVPSSGRKRP